MSVSPRMRDCRFSSISPNGAGLERGRDRAQGGLVDRIDRDRLAPDPEPGRELGGVAEAPLRGVRARAAGSPVTAGAPSASTARIATSVESMPPESPRWARAKPVLRA